MTGYRKKFFIVVIIALTFISVNLHAQFGKNKVQYESFTWKYIQSLNFDIYYVEGSKYLGEFTAYAAEDALKSIENTLNYKLTQKVTLVIYDSHNQFQQTNVLQSFMSEGVGGVTELFKNRVVLPFQGDYAQFRHVVHHELVHAVLNDMFYGGTFQTAISSSNGFFIPTWMNEGFAEWESIGGMNTQTDMFMRDLTISEKLPSLDRLDGYTAYRAGQTFYWYIAKNYGKERVGDFINKLKIYKSVDIAFTSTFNMSFKDFSEKWEKDIKKFYWPDLETFQDPKDYATALTNHDKDETFYNSSPAISPNGERYAYISAPDGIFAVMINSFKEGSKPRKLVSSFRSQDFEDLNMLSPGISWNPQGTKLAISAKAGGEDAVFIVDVESGDYDKLTWGLKSITSVQWSPDGSELAFIATTREQSDIYVYKLASKELINITNDIFSDEHPVWAPDSKSIYFISDRGSNTKGFHTIYNFEMWNYNYKVTDIYRIMLDKGDVTRITYDPENEKTSLAVTPDNNHILYVSDKNGIGNLYYMDINTGATRPLTNSITGITQISLARDASKLLFSTQIKGGYDIYMIRFPLENDLKIDELPLTKFKKEEFEKEKILAAMVTEDSTVNKKPEKLAGYGDVEVDFANQELVKPNTDVQQKAAGAGTEATNTDSTASAYHGIDSTRTSDFVEHDYKIKFTPDVILGNPGFNTFYGAQGVMQMLFSDVLGDHQIYFQGNFIIDLQNSQFYLAYSYLPEIIDYQVAAYHSSLLFQTDPNDIYRFRNYGLSIMASYPFDIFRRMDFTLNWMNLSKDNITSPGITQNNVSKMLIVPEVSYVHDNSLWGVLAPNRGSRYYVDVKYSPKIGGNGSEFATIEGDFRQYFALTDYIGFAFRGKAGASFGNNAQKFYLGGTENWINRQFNSENGYYTFDQPEDFAFYNFEMPLRGWYIGQISGSRYFVGNAEFRFPILTALIAVPIPFSFMGAIFYDVGGAWDGTEFNSIKVDPISGDLVPANLLMSTGIGIRTVLLGLPWKLDVAWRNEYSGWSQPQYLFSIGLDY